ncbi:MAG: hypothetical protein ACRDRL_31705, partial [Sciscionella sp.]
MAPLDFSSQGTLVEQPKAAPDFSSEGTPLDFSGQGEPVQTFPDLLRSLNDRYLQLAPNAPEPPKTFGGFLEALGQSGQQLAGITVHPLVKGVADLLDYAHGGLEPGKLMSPEATMALSVVAPEISPAAGTGAAIARAAKEGEAARVEPKAPDFSAEGTPVEAPAPEASPQEAPAAEPAPVETPPAPDFSAQGEPVAEPPEGVALAAEMPKPETVTVPLDFSAAGEPVEPAPAETAAGETAPVAPPPAPPEPPSATEPPPELPPLTEPRLTQPLHQKTVAAAETLLTQGKVTRDPSMLLSDQIADLLSTDRLDVPTIKATLDAHGLTLEQFSSDLFRTNIRKAAQDMQTLSA